MDEVYWEMDVVALHQDVDQEVRGFQVLLADQLLEMQQRCRALGNSRNTEGQLVYGD